MLASAFGCAAQASETPAADAPLGPDYKAELREVFNKVARSFGVRGRFEWRVEDSLDGAIARVSGRSVQSKFLEKPILMEASVELDRTEVVENSANTLAFVIAHELARVYLGDDSDPLSESLADPVGAHFAVAAGYDPARYIEAMLARPDACSGTAGCRHVRALRIAQTLELDTSWYDPAHDAHLPAPASGPHSGHLVSNGSEQGTTGFAAGTPAPEGSLP